jgi:hypothetical protein
MSKTEAQGALESPEIPAFVGGTTPVVGASPVFEQGRPGRTMRPGGFQKMKIRLLPPTESSPLPTPTPSGPIDPYYHANKLLITHKYSTPVAMNAMIKKAGRSGRNAGVQSGPKGTGPKKNNNKGSSGRNASTAPKKAAGIKTGPKVITKALSAKEKERIHLLKLKEVLDKPVSADELDAPFQPLNEAYGVDLSPEDNKRNVICPHGGNCLCKGRHTHRCNQKAGFARRKAEADAKAAAALAAGKSPPPPRPRTLRSFYVIFCVGQSYATALRNTNTDILVDCRGRVGLPRPI